MMRVFVGIELPDLWREALVAGCQTVRELDPAWAGDKWVPAENLHVTLKFMGDLPDDTAKLLAPDLAAALADVPRFDLPLLQPLLAAPDRRKATMLWTTLRDPDGAAADLASRIEDVAADYGVVPDSKHFKPHITLVRTRSPRAFTVAEESEAAIRAVLGSENSMSVGSVTVFRSRLTSSRPFYETLGTARLAD